MVKRGQVPRISIITPTYNSECFLPYLIHSILKQDYDNFEHIFVDNGSTDRTHEIINEYAEMMPNKVKLIIKPGLFVGAAVTHGFQHVTGDIIGWVDSDDGYYEGAWKKILAAFKGSKETNFVYGNTNIVNGEGKLINFNRPRLFDITETARDDFSIIFCSTFYRRKLVEEIGFLNDLGSQMDFFIRVAKHSQMKYIDSTLGFWRQHRGQYSDPNNPRWRKIIGAVLKENFKLGLANGGSLTSKRSIRYYRFLVFSALGVYNLRRKLCKQT